MNWAPLPLIDDILLFENFWLPLWLLGILGDVAFVEFVGGAKEDKPPEIEADEYILPMV